MVGEYPEPHVPLYFWPWQVNIRLQENRMTQLPEWVPNPTHPDAAAQMAADIAGAVARQKLYDIMDSTPGVGDSKAVAAMPRFQSEVAFDTMRLTAKLQAATDQSLNHQAAHIVEENLHLHHPDEYDTAEQYFAGALADTNRSKSEASDLRFYASTVVPYMKAEGIPGAAKVWVKDENVKKARAAKPKLNQAFKERERARAAGDEVATRQVEQIIGNIIKDGTDASVTANQFIAKHHGADLPPDMDALKGIKYLQGQGTIMILVAMTEAQRIFVEESLGTFSDWSLGDGHEGVLAVLPKFIPPTAE